MDKELNRPKDFGEILEYTFRLTKSNFSNFFLILLIFLGPIYLLQAMIELSSGVKFFREVGTGGNWFEKTFSTFAETESTSLAADLGIVFISLLSVFLMPIAMGAILFAIDRIRKGEEYDIGSVIRLALARYWPMVGSTVLYGMMAVGLIMIPTFIITIVGIIGAVIAPAAGILLTLVLLIGSGIGLGLLLTKWSFYFGSVVFREGTPGFARSWHLTKNRTWISFVLYLVFSLIIFCISLAIDFIFGLLLGNSVLLSLIVNAAALFTGVIFTVGYAVMFFDLKVRQNA